MGENSEENLFSGRSASLEEISRIWDGALLENKRHFLRAILETFSDARVSDDGQRIGLVEFGQLAKDDFCQMPKNIAGYIAMAYDSDRKIFNCGQAKKATGIITG
ncbi:MAG: hypothetical protein Q8L10_01265 [Candidatus Moranbacteria bacterium]|nr:hypothetical protein [Candidatus Moranbacteria bacterium]